MNGRIHQLLSKKQGAKKNKLGAQLSSLLQREKAGSFC
jgi:hypothetical protein